MTVFGGNSLTISTQLTMVPRILEYQFGAGLKQTAPDGINYLLESWDCFFENITLTQYNALLAWYATADPTTTFSTTMPGNSVAKTYRTTKDGYTVTFFAGNIYTVNLKIEQVY